jgi:hypothetical protein
MNPLVEILTRNQGQVLTPELIVGILHGFDAALPEHMCSVLPTRIVPEPVNADPRLLCNDRERVGEWVAKRVGQLVDWGGFAAIGLLDDKLENLVAAGLLNNITATNANAHIAFDGKYALKRVLIRAFFDYAFNVLRLERLTGLVDADNEDALRFDYHIGFKHEFTIKNGNGGDVMMLVMHRDDCRWIKRS